MKLFVNRGLSNNLKLLILRRNLKRSNAIAGTSRHEAGIVSEQIRFQAGDCKLGPLLCATVVDDCAAFAVDHHKGFFYLPQCRARPHGRWKHLHESGWVTFGPLCQYHGNIRRHPTKTKRIGQHQHHVVTAGDRRALQATPVFHQASLQPSWFDRYRYSIAGEKRARSAARMRARGDCEIQWQCPATIA